MNGTTSMQHLRARHAAQSGIQDTKEVEGFPVLIRTQGLLPALMLTQKGDGYRIVDQVVDWLLRQWPQTPFKDRQKGTLSLGSLVDGYTAFTAMEAAAVDREAIAYASTLKMIVRLRKRN